ncbi:unnamed protein product [Camellia sinensis]
MEREYLNSIGTQTSVVHYCMASQLSLIRTLSKRGDNAPMAYIELVQLRWFMKLRPDRVLSESYKLEETLAMASSSVEKPENWVAPYPKYVFGVVGAFPATRIRKAKSMINFFFFFAFHEHEFPACKFCRVVKSEHTINEVTGC